MQIQSQDERPQKCKEFVPCSRRYDNTANGMRPCARQQTKGSPYCWQHTAVLREVAKSLNNTTDGDSLNAALLVHLTVEFKATPGDRKTPAVHALEGLDHSQESSSLGALEQPVEIIQNIIPQLSLRDLRNFKAVNSRARSMVGSSYQYRNVIAYGSEVISALYKTELDSIWPLIRIYDVLTQDRCVGCNRFGGYIFLPGLQRCCERCARYDPELIPTSLGTASKNDKSVVRRLNRRVPMMLWVAGDDLTKLPRSDRWRAALVGTEWGPSMENLYLVSSANAARVGKVSNRSSGRVCMPCNRRHKYSWRQAAVPMPHLEPKTQIVTRGYHCKACTRAKHPGAVWRSERPNCRGCQRSMPNGLDIDHANLNPIRWRQPPCHEEDEWNASLGAISCRLDIANGRLYTRDEFLVHLAECGEAQSLLADLGPLDKFVKEAVKLPKHEGKTKRRRLANYYKY